MNKNEKGKGNAMYALGIDIGTTKIAAILADMDTGEMRVLSGAPTPTLAPGFAGEHIQDAAKMIELVRGMIDECIADGLDSQSIAAIGISGQMHGIVYLDSKGGAVSPLYTWQDSRGKSYAEGPTRRAGYGHATHAYNADHGLVPPTAKGYATVADAVCTALCGLSEPILHASSAASMGCFDIDKNRFFGRAKDYPYEIESAYRIAGSYRGIPVAIGIGDNQASVLGSGTLAASAYWIPIL